MEIKRSVVRKRKFNPEGYGYDYQGAFRAGIEAGARGKWSSRNPRTGLILKGRKHRTWGKTVRSEVEAGYRIIKRGKRYYSIPK